VLAAAARSSALDSAAAAVLKQVQRYTIVAAAQSAEAEVGLSHVKGGVDGALSRALELEAAANELRGQVQALQQASRGVHAAKPLKVAASAPSPDPCAAAPALLQTSSAAATRAPPRPAAPQLPGAHPAAAARGRSRSRSSGAAVGKKRLRRAVAATTSVSPGVSAAPGGAVGGAARDESAAFAVYAGGGTALADAAEQENDEDCPVVAPTAKRIRSIRGAASSNAATKVSGLGPGKRAHAALGSDSAVAPAAASNSMERLIRSLGAVSTVSFSCKGPLAPHGRQAPAAATAAAPLPDPFIMDSDDMLLSAPAFIVPCAIPAQSAGLAHAAAAVASVAAAALHPQRATSASSKAPKLKTL